MVIPEAAEEAMLQDDAAQEAAITEEGVSENMNAGADETVPPMFDEPAAEVLGAVAETQLCF